MTQITKNLGGRPSKFTPEIYPQIEEYIESCGKENMSLPTIEGLALHLNLNKETIYNWSEQHPEFSNAIKKILMKQKTQLMDDGMYGGKEVNSTMAIFLLKVNHGMRDGGDTTNIQVNFGKAMDNELKEFSE